LFNNSEFLHEDSVKNVSGGSDLTENFIHRSQFFLILLWYHILAASADCDVAFDALCFVGADVALWQ